MMDNFGWDNSVSINPPSLWANNQYADYCIISGRSELNASFFNPSSEHSIGMEMLAPAFDSMGDNILDLDFLQHHQQAPSLLQASQELQISSCNNLSSSGDSESSQAESSKNRGSKRKSSGGGFQIFFERSPKAKKGGSDGKPANIDFRQDGGYNEPDTEAIAQVKEMIYRAAAMRPVNLVTEDATERPRRKNVRISSDPQTVAARHRRERISERLRVLQRLVPGGSKMDTASMLDEAANYLKFLKSQVSALETLGTSSSTNPPLIPPTMPFSSISTQQAFPMQSAALFAHLPKP